MQHIIAYDIVDDKNRRKVVKILTQYSFRVQKSVFEGFVSHLNIKELMENLEKVIDPKVDSIRCYPLCKTCAGQLEIIGIGKKTESIAYAIV